MRRAETLTVKRPAHQRSPLHLLAAIGAECQTFLTNDRRLPTVPGLQVKQLSAYVT